MNDKTAKLIAKACKLGGGKVQNAKASWYSTPHKKRNKLRRSMLSLVRILEERGG